MKATPDEFNYTYVRLSLSGDINNSAIQKIKDNLLNNKDSEYIGLDGNKFVIFMKTGNPVDAFKAASKGLCEFDDGFTHATVEKWLTIAPPTKLWRDRYRQYTGKTVIPEHIRIYETE